ncbi:reverse transcriptase domain-containing protein [Tanacetum coccineum]
MYLTTLAESISAALLERREERQVLIYFISKVLKGAELNYPALEKLVLALVHATRRLRRYFQPNSIMVLTNTPIKQTLASLEKPGRVTKWAIELGEHDIKFRECSSAKKQIPKDFPIEMPSKEEKITASKMETKKENPKLANIWKLYTDGASSFDGSDSQLMVNQIKVLFEAKQPATKQYLEKVKEILKGSIGASPSERSINDKEVSRIETEKEVNWMTLIYEYFLSGLLPEDPKEARKIRIRAPQYKQIKGRLYKKSFLTPWLCCVGPSQTGNIIKEIHEGSCGLNIGPSSMVVKVIKHGYYWPSMHRDAAKIIQDYTQCQEFGVPKTISSKDDKQYKEGIFADFCKGLKITQSFFPITENGEIMNHIEKQLVQSQQGWAIIPSATSLIPKSEEHIIKAKRKEGEKRKGPHIISGVYEGELYKITDVSDYSLVQTVKGTSLWG